ncbi:MAG: class I SAM-dependent methyltransferase [Pseudomonadota bacterium]
MIAAGIPYHSHSCKIETLHTLSLLEPCLADSESILDIGCGSGYVCAAIQATGKEDLCGIDIVDTRRARTFPFQLYDGLSTGFSNERFDLVLLCFVLHHVPDQDKTRLLREAIRVCRKSIFILEDTPINAIDRLFSKRHGESYRKTIGSQASFGFHTKAKWEQILRGENLELRESRRLGRFSRAWYQPYARSVFVGRKPSRQ